MTVTIPHFNGRRVGSGDWIKVRSFGLRTPARQKKQDELLGYLGVEHHRLDSKRIHLWALPPLEVEASIQIMLDVLDTYAGATDDFLVLTSPSGAFRAVAIKAGGVSLVLLPSAVVNQDAMRSWLAHFGFKGAVDLSAHTKVLTEEHWQKLNEQKLMPDILWAPLAPGEDEGWSEIIKWAQQNKLSPTGVLRRLKLGNVANESAGDSLTSQTMSLF